MEWKALILTVISVAILRYIYPLEITELHVLWGIFALLIYHTIKD